MLNYLKYQKNKIFVFSVFLYVTGISYGQTEVKVTFKNNSEQIYKVDVSGKLWFDKSDLIINTDDIAARINISLSEIRKITFKEEGPTSGSNDASGNTNKVYIFPNPAYDYFDLVASNNRQLNVRIFDSNGILVMSGKYESGNSVQIAHLSKGMYIVIINNESFKLIKQ